MAVISKKILEIIKNNSGLILNGAHQNYISSYVFERLKELNLTEEEYEKYLSKSNYELTMLINAAAINETYFF